MVQRPGRQHNSARPACLASPRAATSSGFRPSRAERRPESVWSLHAAGRRRPRVWTRLPSQTRNLLRTGQRRASGESEVRGAARDETRFHFRTGITRAVPWLVVSDSGSARRQDRRQHRDSSAPIGVIWTRAARCKMRKSPARRWRPGRPLCSHAIGAASRVAVLVAAFDPLREPGDLAAACRFDPIVSNEPASISLPLVRLSRSAWNFG